MARKDNMTMELPGITRRVGRPCSGKALSGAERQAKWRASRAIVPVGDSIPATIKRLAAQFNLTEAQVTRELLRFALCNKNWGRDGFPSPVTKTTPGAA